MHHAVTPRILACLVQLFICLLLYSHCYLYNNLEHFLNPFDLSHVFIKRFGKGKQNLGKLLVCDSVIVKSLRDISCANLEKGEAECCPLRKASCAVFSKFIFYCEMPSSFDEAAAITASTVISLAPVIVYTW